MFVTVIAIDQFGFPFDEDVVDVEFAASGEVLADDNTHVVLVTDGNGPELKNLTECPCFPTANPGNYYQEPGKDQAPID